MTPANTETWFPLFEFADWVYQSFLVLPTKEEDLASPGTAVTAKKWAKGALGLGQAFTSGDSYTVGGTLSFGPGIELTVSAKGAFGSGNTPATFEATGTGTEGKIKGAIYQLTGWAFADQPVAQGAGVVRTIRGSIRAVRGPDAKPESEPGGMPLGTVGLFVIVRTN